MREAGGDDYQINYQLQTFTFGGTHCGSTLRGIGFICSYLLIR